MRRGTVTADCRIPALVVKTGRDPMHSGEVGVIRTLGRLGVPVYTLAEDRFTPAALSGTADMYSTGDLPEWRIRSSSPTGCEG